LAVKLVPRGFFGLAEKGAGVETAVRLRPSWTAKKGQLTVVRLLGGKESKYRQGNSGRMPCCTGMAVNSDVRCLFVVRAIKTAECKGH
jgi:hypothetical protein